MNKIDLIIPIYNALNDTQQCLYSILENFNFKLGNVYVINDCSNEETTKYLRDFTQKYNNINLLENDENLGFVKTCNKGMQLAQEEIVILLNSDTKIPKEFCERIIKCFNSGNKIGVASPIGSFTATYFIPMFKGYTLEKMNILLRKKHKCVYPVIPAAEGFCFCIRRSVIEQQGYFDEVFGKGYNEEVDFAYRAITNGWKNVLIDDLYVYHKRQASFGKEQRKLLIEQNNTVFYERWEGFREQYIKQNLLKNPINKIMLEVFPMKFYLMIFKKIKKKFLLKSKDILRKYYV